MSADWRSLDNPYSDPSYPSGTQTTQAPNSVAANLINQGITDLTPFKIVPFSWLVEIGKAITGRWQKTDNNGTLDLGMMLFTGDEPYLPLGDCMIRWGTSQTWVVLVKNESNYCTKIDDGSWKRVTVSRGCNGTNVYWSTRAVQDDNRNYGKYKVVGDIFVTGDSEWWWTNTNTASKIGGSWGERTRVFAAVDKRYLSINKNFNRDTQSVTIAALNGDYSCRFRMRFTATSPFNTFNINGDDAGLNRDFNTSWPKYMFFDIIPRTLIAGCCSNTLSNEIDLSSCGESWANPSTDSCKSSMPGYCKGDNLKKVACMKFCKTNDCDNELEKFCNAGTYAEQKKKYTENKELCSCFMPRTFYQKFDEEYYAKMGPSGKKLVDLLKASGVYGGLPECSNLQCKFGGTTIQHSTFKQGSCPSIQIQNCINSAANSNQGTLKAGTIDSSQTNNCVQQSTTNASSSSSPSKSNLNVSGNTQQPLTKSNTTLYLIIGGIILLLIIILVLVLVLSGDEAPKVVYVPQPPTPVSQFLKLRK